MNVQVEIWGPALGRCPSTLGITLPKTVEMAGTALDQSRYSFSMLFFLNPVTWHPNKSWPNMGTQGSSPNNLHR